MPAVAERQGQVELQPQPKSTANPGQVEQPWPPMQRGPPSPRAGARGSAWHRSPGMAQPEPPETPRKRARSGTPRPAGAGAGACAVPPRARGIFLLHARRHRFPGTPRSPRPREGTRTPSTAPSSPTGTLSTPTRVPPGRPQVPRAPRGRNGRSGRGVGSGRNPGLSHGFLCEPVSHPGSARRPGPAWGARDAHSAACEGNPRL